MESADEKGKYVFHQLIKKEGDYIGMIAYCLYKLNKIDYIVDYKKNHDGHKPSDDDLKRFQENHCVERQLKLYRDNAESITKDFYSLLFEKKNNQLELKHKELKKIESDIKERENKITARERSIKLREKHCNMKPQHSFWMNVFQNIFSTFLFILLSIIIVYLIDNNTDLVNRFREYWNK